MSVRWASRTPLQNHLCFHDMHKLVITVDFIVAYRNKAQTVKQHKALPSNLPLTHCFKNGYSLLAEPDGVEDVVVEDGLKQVIFVVGLKWWLARHHLIHQHPQSPPVHWWAIVQLLKDLITTDKSSMFKIRTKRSSTFLKTRVQIFPNCALKREYHPQIVKHGHNLYKSNACRLCTCGFVGVDVVLCFWGHLRCDVIRRPAEGGGGDTIEDSLLAHPKVCQFTVTLCIQQYVVQLQIPAKQEGHSAERNKSTDMFSMFFSYSLFQFTLLHFSITGASYK